MFFFLILALFCSQGNVRPTTSCNQHTTFPRDQSVLGVTATSTSRNQSVVGTAMSTSLNQHTATSQGHFTSTTLSFSPTVRAMATSTSHNQFAGTTAVSTSSSHNQSAGLMATSTSCNQHTVTSQGHGASTLSHNPSVGALATSTSTSTSRNQHTASSQRQDAFVTSSHDQSVVASTRNQEIASSRGQSAFTSREQSAAATSTSPDQHTASSQRQDASTSSRQLSHNDDDGNESEESEAGDDPIPQARAKRNSKKSHRDPRPTHLGFYSGTWYDVLVEAKNRYRLFIHTQNPFPERNRSALRDAHDCLLETVSKYEDNGIQLDSGILNNRSLTYCY